MNKPRADWVAWSLHAALGLYIGAMFAGLLTEGESRRGVRIPLIAKGQAVLFVAGCGLVISGFASRHGDRFWLPTRVIPNLPPEQSRFSLLLSKLMIGAGGGLIVWALAFSIPGLGSRLHSVFFPLASLF